MLDHWRRTMEEESQMKTLAVEGNHHATLAPKPEENKSIICRFSPSYPPLL